MHATLAELMQWLPGAVLHGAADGAVNVDSVVTDSRAVTVGCLFIALCGERFDAHDFLQTVQHQRAAALLVQRLPADMPLQIPAIVVPDTRLALAAIAQHWRAKFTLPVIAVTGSNGKTTVKEMIASILEAAFGPDGQMATRGNFNNEIGVPLTLFRLNPSHRAAVIELGMNHAGEIAVLAAMTRPTIALVNNAQREHQEFMVSVEAVAVENGAVIRALPDDGIAVFPADDAYAALWRKDAGPRRTLTFGLSLRADVRANYTAEAFGSRLQIAVAQQDGRPAQSFALQLNAAGEHNVLNALAATACALAAGIEADAVVRGLEAFAPVSGRLQRKQGVGGALVIDDTYNANPDSVRAAIDVLAQAAAPRVLVLGDMGEVGDQGPQYHEEIGAYARLRRIERVLTLGELARHAAKAYNAAAVEGDSNGAADHFADIDTLNLAAAALSLPGATVLVKGSRFMKMERVVQHLVNPQSAAQQESV
ncbi:MAG: UDP-N-acetylmuramoyl-tripeptide--D-alanyl-D-alanine ligase [Herbaspirillum sp.]|jgi:UDP-N-acetylmuramoyl-tripeptide--D-alanyl-D-alanine ligase|nr:UDP-N-acetylmuramoyl-tripeptide--D-alanyl-D-alanine ligase [Herbaspirillum sp.]